ncbi:MAG: hypothetical protein RSE41_00330 [Clostridia bacterium]
MITTTLKTSMPFRSVNDKYPYRLVLKEIHSPYSDSYMGVFVERDFHNNNQWSGVPSGWALEDVKYNNTLYIDYGQNWFVSPTKEAWENIL